MGPSVCSGLKSKLGAGSVACQGVGGAYSAGLMDNVSAKGTSSAAIQEALTMFNLANSKCPQSIIVAGGYRLVTHFTNMFVSR
jgi:cutinase